MSSSVNSIFTGNSQFSTSFQQVISRAVSFASLPMQQMQSEVATLQAQSSELNTLNGDFSNLQSSIAALNSALSLGSYTAVSSDTSVATASLSGTPAAGTYTVEVDTMGTHASAMSSDDLAKVTDPAVSGISDATSYTLTIGDNSYTIHTSDVTLSSLASAINSSSAGVHATVVNVGSQGSTDYRLSIQDGKMQAVSIQLTSLNGTSNGDLLSPLADGEATTYRVNGKPAADSDPLSTSSSVITLAPGVSVSPAGAGTTTITVGQNTNGVSVALQSFVNAYNTVKAEIDSNRGQGTGALQGQSVLASLSQVLNQITGYSTGMDGISSLTSLGLQFDQTGVLSFDSSAFASATQGQLTQLATFLGSSSAGGFLKTANDALTGLTDSISGLFQSSINDLKDSIARDNQSISDDQDRIVTMTNNLNSQMAAADAAIASLEQQYSYLSQMFQQMQVNQQNGG
jgi:flagellar hook-associated protein 2